jgi:hypothetical protein
VREQAGRQWRRDVSEGEYVGDGLDDDGKGHDDAQEQGELTQGQGQRGRVRASNETYQVSEECEAREAERRSRQSIHKVCQAQPAAHRSG